MTKPPPSHRSCGLRLGPADVMLQLLDHELPVADEALDQITDRDDAEKLTIVDHRQVAHALGAHECHAFLDRFVRLNAYNIAHHDFANQRLWRCATLQKHVASVVPLGKDADDLAAVEHQQRADVLVGHHLDRVVHRVARMDGPYLMTLVIEDVTNCCHNRGQAGLLLAARTETVFLISSISALSLASSRGAPPSRSLSRERHPALRLP